MIDSHCHLNFDKLANDFENIIRKAKKNNITSILSVNTDPEEFNNHYKLIKKFKTINRWNIKRIYISRMKSITNK